MTDSLPQKIEALSPQLEGLEAAARGLGSDPEVPASVRRIARSLEAAAQGLDLAEVAAGAMAIQRAADAHLARSVENFLARVGEIRADGPTEEVTVLLVEDNQTVAAATTAYLSAPGRDVVLAQTAAEALSVLASRRIDVVILDLILPDRDGRDVLVHMREQVSTSMIPVIVLSSTSNPVARTECLAVGADEFFVKPADPRALRSAVVRQLKSGRIRRDAIRDGLTGLPNRAGITAVFEQMRRETMVAQRSLSVAAITLDSLSEITMKMGRDAGDRFLLEVCAAVHEAVGKGNGLGRWEAAQLVAVLPGLTAVEARQALDRTIRAVMTDGTLAEYLEAGIDVDVSAGAIVVTSGQELRDAISMADRSRYSTRTREAREPDDPDNQSALRTPRVLLVEDDRVTLTLLHHRLVRDGHEVVDFENGADAFRWAEEESFDLAVLDVKVPGMDGFELLAKLRAIPRFEHVPIIMLTGMGSEADVIRGLELGANDYMLKPFSPTELLARVRRLLSSRALEADAARSLPDDPDPTGEAGR